MNSCSPGRPEGGRDPRGLPRTVRVDPLPRLRRRSPDRQADRRGRPLAPRGHRQAARERDVPQVRHKYKITPKLDGEARKLPSRLASFANQLSPATVGAFTALTNLISVLALGFFLLRDGPQLANRLYLIRGPDQEERLRRLGTDIYRSVSGCVAGNIAISVIAGLVAYITLTLLGVGFAAPLAVIVGVFDLLPLVGATIAAIIVGIVNRPHRTGSTGSRQRRRARTATCGVSAATGRPHARSPSQEGVTPDPVEATRKDAIVEVSVLEPREERKAPTIRSKTT